MEEPDKKRIRINIRVILSDVRPSDIADYLFEKEVIDLDTLAMTGLPALTPREKMVKLLKVLFSIKGSFPIFCDALKDSEMEWLVDMLVTTDPNSQEDSSLDKTDSNELDLQERLALQEKILQQQSQFIESLLQQNKANTKNGESTPPVSELPELQSAMKKQGLSEEQVINYIDDLMKRKTLDVDDTDSASPNTCKPRTLSESAVNFTETVAITTAVDVVKYLAYSDDKNKQISKPNIYQTTMRRTVDELILRHRQIFQAYVSQDSSLRQATGINFLLGVADEIFRDGQKNWGRIVALYAFGGWLAKHGIFERQDAVIGMIGDVLGFYIAKNLGEWIEASGGWVSHFDGHP